MIAHKWIIVYEDNKIVKKEYFNDSLKYLKRHNSLKNKGVRIIRSENISK